MDNATLKIIGKKYFLKIAKEEPFISFADAAIRVL